MKNLQRIIIVCLICSFFLGYACMPVKVEASASAVAISAVGAASSAAPYLALGILFLLATGYVIDTLPKLKLDAQTWIDSVPGFAEYLAEQVVNGVESLTVVYIPTYVQEAMRKKAAEHKKEQPDKKYIYLPPNFFDLDKLSQAQLLGTDVMSELQTGNWLAQRLNNITLNIHGAIYEFKDSVQSVLDHIPTSLTALRTQVVSGFDDLSSTMQTFRQNFVNGLSDFQDVVSEFRGAVNQNFAKLQDSLGVKIGDVNIHLHAIRENLTSRLANLDGAFDVKLSDVKTALSGFRTQFIEKIVPLQNTLSTFRTQFVEKVGEIREVVGEIRGDLIRSVSVGIDNIKASLDSIVDSIGNGISITVPNGPSFDSNNPDNEKIGVSGGLGWFGHSYDILGNYGAGLLAAGAILKQFTDMSFFSSLITVSLSIGLVSVFFGIIMNAAQSDGSKSTRPGHNSGNRAKNGG